MSDIYKKRKQILKRVVIVKISLLTVLFMPVSVAFPTICMLRHGLKLTLLRLGLSLDLQSICQNRTEKNK